MRYGSMLESGTNGHTSEKGETK